MKTPLRIAIVFVSFIASAVGESAPGKKIENATTASAAQARARAKLERMTEAEIDRRFPLAPCLEVAMHPCFRSAIEEDLVSWLQAKPSAVGDMIGAMGIQPPGALALLRADRTTLEFFQTEGLKVQRSFDCELWTKRIVAGKEYAKRFNGCLARELLMLFIGSPSVFEDAVSDLHARAQRDR